MVANTADAGGHDDFDGKQPAITVNLPTDGQPSGPMPVQNEGLTEQHLPPMPPPPGPPSFTPTGSQPVLADPRATRVLGQIGEMQAEHEMRKSVSGEMRTRPGHVDVGAFLRAQSRYVREKTAFINNSARPDVDDKMYIDLQNRHSFEQDAYIDALMTMLHQLGVI